METTLNNMEIESRDPELWKIAKKRARYKYDALIYCIVIFFTGRYGTSI
jgi:hypothetical protein